jgi:hypothetical protein
MILLISGATKTIEKYRDHPNIGAFLTPRSGNSKKSRQGLVWGVDNSAFVNFDEKKFINMLKKINGEDCKFVACPDKVGDGEETLRMFYEWRPIIKKYNLPIAIVLQDGITVENVPFDLVDSIFIGGTTKYKLGKDVRDICIIANQLNLWVHMGRVNSNKRLQYAIDIGCDSVDGSGYSMFPDKKIPYALKFLERARKGFLL